MAPTSGTRLARLQWPDLTNPQSPVNPPQGKGAVAVDDLWHATSMARGSFVYARTPTEVSYGLASILAGIQNQRKSRAGAAFSGQVLDAANNIIFDPTIEPGWAGDLLKVEIDPTTGIGSHDLVAGGPTLAAQIDPAKTSSDGAVDRPKTAGSSRSTTTTGPVCRSRRCQPHVGHPE